MTQFVKFLSKIAASISWKWKCLMCGITLETEGQPPKCPNCGRNMTAI